MSEKLLQAQNKEDSIRELFSKNPDLQKQRPLFHFSTPSGWLNDPNGFSVFDGKIHLFFQYYPYEPIWGPMHWGHVSTKNLLVWDKEPVTMAPDSTADYEGCFSGTAIENDGKHIIAYTGVVKEGEVTVQNQCIAIGDGKNYTKLENNPVLTSKDIPFEYNREHFRDPKIWKENDSFYMACTIKQKNQKGALILFKSEDLKNWKYESTIDSTQTDLCGMWECPDIFSLNEKDVIIFSPQDMKEDLELGFHDGNNVIYMTGKMDSKTHKFVRETRIENGFSAAQIDYGIDFYAPETTLLSDGRRIMIGWMQSWESPITPKNYLWSGMMTFPRVLELKEERLYQNPIKEIEELYDKKISGVLSKNEAKKIVENSSRHLDFELQIPEDKESENGIISLKITQIGKKEEFVTFEYNKSEKSIFFDRSHSKNSGKVSSRKAILKTNKKSTKLRFIIDTCSIEVFVNDGESAFTNCFFFDSVNSDIILNSTFEKEISFEGYSLKN